MWSMLRKSLLRVLKICFWIGWDDNLLHAMPMGDSSCSLSLYIDYTLLVLPSQWKIWGGCLLHTLHPHFEPVARFIQERELMDLMEQNSVLSHPFTDLDFPGPNCSLDLPFPFMWLHHGPSSYHCFLLAPPVPPVLWLCWAPTRDAQISSNVIRICCFKLIIHPHLNFTFLKNPYKS